MKMISVRPNYFIFIGYLKTGGGGGGGGGGGEEVGSSDPPEPPLDPLLYCDIKV